MFSILSSRVLWSFKMAVQFCTILTLSTQACAVPFINPRVMSSQNGQLDLLMVARADTITTFTSPLVAPLGWVFDICQRPLDGSNDCPQVPGTNLYGGTRLKLQKDDVLNVRLVNRLPMITDSFFAQTPGFEFLAMNPTNIHTHGMIVSPHQAGPNDPTYGDYIYVLTFNSANGKVIPGQHLHGDMRYDVTDYQIKIPKNHPSGLFWFHPHVHGVSANQVNAGLSGMITVGSVDDYVKIPGVTPPIPPDMINYMIMKDTQILSNGILKDQADPFFCSPNPSTLGTRLGTCPGQDTTAIGGPDFSEGTWYFTLSGLQYPTVSVVNQSIFALTQSGANRFYTLSLEDRSNQCKMLYQILSLDGVGLNIPPDATPEEIKKSTGGGRFTPVPCPEEFVPPYSPPVCASDMLMVPSSRAEILVAYRDCTLLGGNQLVKAPFGASAVFSARSESTGPGGIFWPQVDLANVTFRVNGLGNDAIVNGNSELENPIKISNDMQQQNAAVGPIPSCKSLPPGHMRRIFYGTSFVNPNTFGLAYEEIDEYGHVVGVPATDLMPFDPINPVVCLPLSPGNTPTTERWELVNLGTEIHTFHIHQVKFWVLNKDESTGEFVPASKGMMLDNLPLPSANGVCGGNPPIDNSNSIDDYRHGLCHPKSVVVEIPFAIAGNFVYHCHILNHEDDGMMARINVVPSA